MDNFLENTVNQPVFWRLFLLTVMRSLRVIAWLYTVRMAEFCNGSTPPTGSDTREGVLSACVDCWMSWNGQRDCFFLSLNRWVNGGVKGYDLLWWVDKGIEWVGSKRWEGVFSAFEFVLEWMLLLLWVWVDDWTRRESQFFFFFVIHKWIEWRSDRKTGILSA